MTIPDETLTAILEAREAATAGEWEVVLSPSGLWAVINDPLNQNIASIVDGTPAVEPSDAAFIVLACNNAAAMVEEIRALREALKPFVREEANFHGHPDDIRYKLFSTLGELRRAAQALKDT